MKQLQIIVIKFLLQHIFAIQLKQHSELFPVVCYEKNDGVVVAMKNSCTGYFICHDGMVVVGSCGDYFRFNARKGVCDHPDNVDCNNQQRQQLTIEKPHPAPKQTFPKPIHPREVNADDSAGPICYFQPDGAFLPNRKSCKEYYICFLQRPYRRTCSHQQHFNSKELSCQDPLKANCSLDSVAFEEPNYMNSLDEVQINVQKFDTSLEEIVAISDDSHDCTDLADGSLLPHSKACEKLIFCLHGKALELWCPHGLQFNPHHMRCEWPWVANCKIWKIPGDD